MTQPSPVLGLLPAIRGGLGELAKAGQNSRLIDGYLRRYAAAFGEVRYLSYLDGSPEAYTAAPDLLARIRVLRGGRLHPQPYTFLMPLRYREELRGCSVLRVLQITGVIPALMAKRLFGVPFITTYGFRDSWPARSGLTGALRAMVERAGLAQADVFVLPSFTEGQPKVLREAMSCGLPCIASAVGGNFSIVYGGLTGLLFDPAVSGALAACLLRVFEREDLLPALGLGARAEIAARYDLRVLVAREIGLLRRVAGSRRVP